jgi:SSS family solute:Na+ symporter
VDIYRRHLVKGRDDRHYLKTARWFGCLAGASMIVGAIILAHSKTKTLQDTANILVSLCGGGLLGMYLLGFLTKRGDWRSVVAGIVCTTIFSFWTVLSRKQLLPAALCAPFDLYYTGMIGHALMFAVGYGASFLFPSTNRDLTNLTVYTQDGSPLE